MASIPGLPDDVKEKLEELLQKDPSELTQDEVGFLNARRWVLNARQRVLFASVLVDATEEEKQGVPRTAHVPQNTQYIDPHQTAPNKVTAEDGQIADDHKDNPEGENTEQTEDAENAAADTQQEGQVNADTADKTSDPYGANVDQFDPSAI